MACTKASTGRTLKKAHFDPYKKQDHERDFLKKQLFQLKQEHQFTTTTFLSGGAYNHLKERKKLHSGSKQIRKEDL